MSNVWKHPQSQFLYAAFYDIDGKRRNRSTKIRAVESLRKRAEGLANKFEEAAQNKRTALQARRVIADLTTEITGSASPNRSCPRIR
jgi:hypothetical protein